MLFLSLKHYTANLVVFWNTLIVHSPVLVVWELIMHLTWLSLEVTSVYRVIRYLTNSTQMCAQVCFWKGLRHVSPPTCYSQMNVLPWTHTHTHTHTHTITHPLIYPTRIQLLNSASGSIASWLHHPANPSVISSNSPHPLSCSTSRVCSWPPIRTWFNENRDAHLTFPGPMNINERHVLLTSFCAVLFLCIVTGLVTVC